MYAADIDQINSKMAVGGKTTSGTSIYPLVAQFYQGNLTMEWAKVMIVAMSSSINRASSVTYNTDSTKMIIATQPTYAMVVINTTDGSGLLTRYEGFPANNLCPDRCLIMTL